MNRFFVKNDDIFDDYILIRGEHAHHIKAVLRLRKDEKIIVLDNRGREMITRLNKIENDVVEAIIESFDVTKSEPLIDIYLYQALLKSNSFERVIQKCTEIGVAVFVPVICERCVAKIPGDSKMSRWRKVAQQAAEQSGRGKIPVIEKVVNFAQACNGAQGLSILPWESERTQGIKTVLHKNKGCKKVCIFIGPEGGFSQVEIDYAAKNGIVSVSLGRRTLKAETAGEVAASVVCYEFDEMEI